MTTAAASLLPVGTALVWVLAVLFSTAVTVAALARLAPDHGTSRARQVLTAGLRAALQLAAVSAIIGWIARSPAGLPVFLLLMYAVAARTAGRRITADHTWRWATVPIAVSVAPAVALLLATGLVPVTGIALIPITGILIGGAMTATALAGRQSLTALNARHGEVEAALALGMADRDARLEIARPAASEALIPGLDQTRTVGLVTLPGAFVGMLLGGATPFTAGAVQLFVLIALMAVQAVAVATTLELIARGRITAPPDHETASGPRPPWGVRLRRRPGPERPRRGQPDRPHRPPP